MSKPKSKRLPQLDFLRGVAILLVLGAHAQFVLPAERAGIFRPFVQCADRFGWTGVDLFFVLSGFLVGGLLFSEVKRTSTFDPKRFIIRRGFRIWPAYYIFLAWLVVGGMRGGHSLSAASRPLWMNFLHIQSYVPSPAMHTWTLAVEEHFYLLLPLLLWALIQRHRIAWFPGIFGVIALCCLTMRYVACLLVSHVYIHHDAPPPWMYVVQTPTHMRIDALMCGVLIAYLHHLRPETFDLWRASARARIVLFCAGILLLTPALLWDTSTTMLLSIGLTSLYAGYACILIACLYSPPDAFRNPFGRLVGWVGVWSYSIYLFHFKEGVDRGTHLLPHLSHMNPSMRWLIAVSVYVICAVGFGFGFGTLIEKPTLAIRDRWFPKEPA
jgi:peptidoglycan/LPS O-acetylase OafA/YrhL